MYDVAIIGGGPAGSTAATLLARAGRRVIVFEREKFPRFHIGESLLPFSMQTFERLGVREKLDRAFLPKFGGQVVAACGSKDVKFYFKDGYRSRRDRAYQVTRSEFDKLLLDHSRENGAEIREQTEVKRIEFLNGGVHVEFSNHFPSPQRSNSIETRYLLDCSGRQSVLGNLFGLKKNYDHLQKFSVFAHYEDVDREKGIDGTLIRMVRGLDRWFWIIPLTPTRASVGVVMDTSTFRAIKLSPEEALEKCIGEQPMMLERMSQARRVSPVYSAGDYSYRNTRFFGDRWLLAGDAAGFIDPVFSSGVFLAVMSGEKAADTLDQILGNESRRRRLFKSYSRSVNRMMDAYLGLVNSWYGHSKEFVEVFLNPTDTMQIAAAVNAVLAGNADKNFQIKWRLWLFYFFINIQRFLPLSPRLSFVPQIDGATKLAEPIGATS